MVLRIRKIPKFIASQSFLIGMSIADNIVSTQFGIFIDLLFYFSIIITPFIANAS